MQLKQTLAYIHFHKRPNYQFFIEKKKFLHVDEEQNS